MQMLGCLPAKYIIFWKTTLDGWIKPSVFQSDPIHPVLAPKPRRGKILYHENYRVEVIWIILTRALVSMKIF